MYHKIETSGGYEADYSWTEWTTDEAEEFFDDMDRYQWVAQQSVLLPDPERRAFLCEHLRKDA